MRFRVPVTVTVTGNVFGDDERCAQKVEDELDDQCVRRINLLEQ
jgi:hypothetical protein